MKDTRIEWADHSWSPWRGCTKVSKGCENCYAETLSKRNPAVLGEWGKGRPRVLAKNWIDPVHWQKQTAMDMPRPRVFPSLCDWLDDEVPIEWLARFLKLIHDTPSLDWLLLTKRPANWESRSLEACQHLASMSAAEAPAVRWLMGWRRGWDLPRNVWFGVSVEDQERAKERIPILLGIPAAVRWLSLEPLLGPVDLTHIDCESTSKWCQIDALTGRHTDMGRPCFEVPKLDWLVIGGESGPKARPCNIRWIRHLAQQGRDAGVPVFVKQMGARVVLPPCRQNHFDWRHKTSNHDRPDDKLFVEDGDQWRVLLRDPKGGDALEWPEAFRIRNYPRK